MVCGIIAMLPMLFLLQADILMACCIIILISLTERYCKYIEKCAEYLETGDEELGKEIQREALDNFIELALSILLMYTIRCLVKAYTKPESSGESGDGAGGTGEPSGEVKPDEGISGGETSGIESGLDADIQNKFNDLLNSDYYKNDSGYDCSEIAEDFYEAANNKGIIYHIEGKNGSIYGYEYGNIFEFEYHEVYSDGTYIYDPRYKNVPIMKNEYFKALKEINPEGFDVFIKTQGGK